MDRQEDTQDTIEIKVTVRKLSEEAGRNAASKGGQSNGSCGTGGCKGGKCSQVLEV